VEETLNMYIISLCSRSREASCYW